MTTRQTCGAARTRERGSALVGVLLLLMMMSALAAALGVSGRTETLITRNHRSAGQARAAAEAGLNVAVQATIGYLRTIDPDDVPAVLDTLLNDTSALAPVAFATRTGVPGAADPDAEYEVLLMDEDDAVLRGADATTLTDDADAGNDEDNNRLSDNNSTIVIRATGFASDNSSVMLEAVLAPVPLGAIVTDGNLDISGSVAVNGAGASVHSNGDLTIGGSATVSGPITASGTYTGPLGGSGGQPEVPLPSIRAEDYRHHANFILTSTGDVTQPDGTVLCSASGNQHNCRDSHGWSFNAGTWSIGSQGTPLGTYYVEGAVQVGSNSTLQVTIIAEGSIDLSGSPNLTAHTDELLFVTDGDLDISGGIDTDVIAQGQMLVHEQVSISGNATLGGQLIVEDSRPSLDPLVDVNSISGNVTIDYNGTLGSNLFFVTGWREVR